MLSHRHRRAEAGVSLIEVLIAMVLIAFGLLGLAALQSKSQLLELEAYQRSQALVLLDDMAQRMRVNSANAPDYVTGTPLGTGDAEPADCSGEAVGVDLDHCEWSAALKGSAEVNAGNNVGAMIGARGCIQQIRAANPATGFCEPGIYRVTVAWQGLHTTTAPALACGLGEYGDEALRRAISQDVVFGLPRCL